MRTKHLETGEASSVAPASNVVQTLPIQKKLAIGAVDDPLEHEADNMADKVMGMQTIPAVTKANGDNVQRKCAECEKDEDEKIQRKPLISFIQRKGSGSGAIANDNISSQINASKGNGNNMDSATKSFMESGFGADFSEVKIHTNNEAVQMNRELSAKAFTVGNDIYFNEREYQPNSDNGKHLLAHELTHSIQQGNGIAIQRQANPANNGGLSDEMLEQIVIRLRNAMEGWGTDEEAIYSAFSGRTQDEVNAIQRSYNNRYHRSLLDDIQDELNEDEMRHLGIFSPTAVEGHANRFAEMAASQLHNAMEGWGTDESSIMSVLTGRTLDERRAIQDAYMNLTHRNLRDDLIDELSGTELTMALRLLEQGMLNTEDQVYFAIAGLGTDEEGLRNALRRVQGNRAGISALIDAYKAKGYGDLLADVRDDLSGSDLDQSLESLHGATPSHTCNAAQRNVALFAISEATSMAQKAIDRLSTDIARGQLSDDVETGLKNNFNRGNAAGVININLARNVLPAFINSHRDLLMTSDVDCGDIGLCVGNQDCSSPTGYTSAWTGVGRLSVVQLCSSFFSCDDDKPTRILHEFIHHTGVNDQVYRFQPGFANLTPLGDGSATDSLNNADSYAYFAKGL